MPPYPCTIVTEVVRPEGYVPNWLPGKNDQIYSFSDYYGLPRELYFDGAETMYPDYRGSSSAWAARARGKRRDESRRCASVSAARRFATLPAPRSRRVASPRGAPSAEAQQRAQRGGESAAELHWWPVRENIWMLVGAGTNIAASVGPDGVLLVNTGDGASEPARDRRAEGFASAAQCVRLPRRHARRSAAAPKRARGSP